LNGLDLNLSKLLSLRVVRLPVMQFTHFVSVDNYGGDRDAIRNSHLVEMHESIPGSLLCILPGTTHFPYEDRTRWFLEILYDFFDHPPRRTTTAQLFK